MQLKSFLGNNLVSDVASIGMQKEKILLFVCGGIVGVISR